MNTIRISLILAAAFLAVYLEAASDWPRRWLGTQIDLLPGLMVYASLSSGFAAVTLLAIFGGCCFDSLSANPMGITTLPLFALGLALLHFRHLILRDQAYAQWILGLAASALMPLLALLLLYTAGRNPFIGAGSIWQWLVASLGGAALTPLYFVVFDHLERAFSYHPLRQTSFRPDREIERGRN